MANREKEITKGYKKMTFIWGKVKFKEMVKNTNRKPVQRVTNINIKGKEKRLLREES